MPEAKIVLYSDSEDEVTIPARWDVCPACRGRKKVPLQGIAFTADDMAEDPDFAEDYRRGFYDRPCTECKGEGLVAVPDEPRCSPEQLAAYREYAQTEAEYQAMRRSEIAFGC